jgi:O-acetyl-ADP-ribose deacetylase (regulator of RNase III)
MRTQGDLEATGIAKITSAYALPSDYVLHTVGPIYPETVRRKREEGE